jgi:hypothetical protein
MSSSSKRHFTAVVGSKEHGLYISSSPSSAARKIVSKLCASSKSKKVEFCVREITQGSKKKTYGPYLGEMKKLAKPIELKGRVIRYAPEVHLKKKKTATKTLKTIGKKMRGGDIDMDGILTDNDFLIRDVDIICQEIDSNNKNHQKHYNLGNRTMRPLTRFSIKNFYEISPCRLKIKKDRFQEPFIFFGKKIYGELNIINKINYYVHYEPIVHYEYVAFNKGFPPFKTAGFKKVNIHRNGFECYYSFPEIRISEIPNDALIQLRDFILNERIERNDPTFCNTIYTAVVVKLTGPPEQQQHNNE